MAGAAFFLAGAFLAGFFLGGAFLAGFFLVIFFFGAAFLAGFLAGAAFFFAMPCCSTADAESVEESAPCHTPTALPA